MAYFAGVGVDFVVLYPEICGGTLGFILANYLFFGVGEPEDGVSPARALGMQLIDMFIYPDLAIFE